MASLELQNPEIFWILALNNCAATWEKIAESVFVVRWVKEH
jgi:hypothetical protein